VFTTILKMGLYLWDMECASRLGNLNGMLEKTVSKTGEKDATAPPIFHYTL
jgi:hypothetical protein